MESDGGEHKTWELDALQPLDGEWLSGALVLPECSGRRAAPVIDCFMSHQVHIGARGGEGGGLICIFCVRPSGRGSFLFARTWTAPKTPLLDWLTLRRRRIQQAL